MATTSEIDSRINGRPYRPARHTTPAVTSQAAYMIGALVSNGPSCDTPYWNQFGSPASS
jgi:hypothetical protein